MIEIRLCSIDGAKWLDGLPETVEGFVTKPVASFGGMIDRNLAARLRAGVSAADLKALGASGAVLAPQGSAFDENVLVSAVHAVACAAIVTGVGSADMADTIVSFVRGVDTERTTPRPLRTAGVVACLRGDVAQTCGEWLAQVDTSAFSDEVRDMHGEAAIPDYLTVIESLRGAFIRGTRIQGCDVCCWREPN